MGLFQREDREVVRAGSAGLALVAVALAFGALVTAAHADSKKTGAPAGATQVTLSEFAITPSSIAASLGGKLVVVNGGAAVHNFNIEGTNIGTKDLQPPESATLGLKGVAKGT